MDRMSAAEYQRTICRPAREASPDDNTLVAQLTGKTLIGVGIKKNKLVVDKNTNIQLEDDLTIQVVEYLELLQSMGKVVLFSHIPQETFTKSWAVKNKNTQMGVRAGVPDLLIVFSNSLLFLELKREQGGVLSAVQEVWIEALDHVCGHVYGVVAKGFDEAKTAIDAQIELLDV